MIYFKVKHSSGDLIVRNIEVNDLEEIADLSYRVFGKGMALSLEHFQSHLKIFPFGQVCVQLNNQIIGNASSLIVNLDDYKSNHTYDEISGSGYIKGHNPKGKSLYGIEVGVDPEFRNIKVGQLLYKARRQICIGLNLKNILIGGRMPFYHKYAKDYSPEQYVKKVINKELYDPVITFQANNGFKFKSILPNYLPDDQESLNYAALLKWENKNYRKINSRD